MSDNSAIEWTDATWNPTTGCSKVSVGCTNCYAEKLSHRFGWTEKPWNAAHATENVKLHGDRLNQPLKWKQPKRIFVNSMSDLFHEQVPDKFIVDVFSVMAEASQHIFQVLTKRPERMMELLNSPTIANDVWLQTSRGVDASPSPWPLPNVWLGVSVENQQAADERIPLLLQTPAAVRFLSCEPLLGPVSLDRWFGLEHGKEWAECICDEIDPTDRPCLTCECRMELGKKSGLHWVITGGESGSNARPMHPEWARSLREQCTGAGVPFFFKQWGGWEPSEAIGTTYHKVSDGSVAGYPSNMATNRRHWWGGKYGDGKPLSVRVGKGDAGRLLDGRTWDEFPAVQL